MASVAHAVAAIIVLAEVSVREDLDRLNVDMRAILEAVTMIPLRYVPIGEVGQPVGAILSWDLIEPGNRFESTVSVVRSTYKACAAEVCYGEMWIWARSKKNRSVKHVLTPVVRMIVFGETSLRNFHPTENSASSRMWR